MLAKKIAQLHHDVVVAERIASFWQKQIDFYGEAKAEAFYRSIGLNHLECKSVEWEGLTLSREPTEAEKLCVKGISQAQDAGKESVGKVLLNTREALINEGMREIKLLSPADYHLLVLEVPENELKPELAKVFTRGKKLVASELAGQKSHVAKETKAITDDEDEALEELADLTNSRLTNDVQARIINSTQRFRLLGLTGAALWHAVRQEIEEGSTSYVDRAATGAANVALSSGRSAEMAERADEIDRYEYSALLDPNVCEPCAAEDGETASDPADLQPTPNPECAGSDFCRCFTVAIAA
jgi:hypothetical protein